MEENIYGMPVTTEGYGLMYNKKKSLIRQGWDPKSIDTFDEL